MFLLPFLIQTCPNTAWKNACLERSVIENYDEICLYCCHLSQFWAANSLSVTLSNTVRYKFQHVQDKCRDVFVAYDVCFVFWVQRPTALRSTKLDAGRGWELRTEKARTRSWEQLPQLNRMVHRGIFRFPISSLYPTKMDKNMWYQYPKALSCSAQLANLRFASDQTSKHQAARQSQGAFQLAGGEAKPWWLQLSAAPNSGWNQADTSSSRFSCHSWGGGGVNIESPSSSGSMDNRGINH